MTKITTRQFTRLDHEGMHVECSDVRSPTSKWRTVTNHDTTRHVPPSFTTGMTRDDVRRLRNLCNAILENVYDDFA